MNNDNEVFDDDDIFGPDAELSQDEDGQKDEIDLNLEQSNAEIYAANKAASKPFYKTTLGIVSISFVGLALIGSFTMGYLNDSKKRPVQTAANSKNKQQPASNKGEITALKKSDKKAEAPTESYELVSAKTGQNDTIKQESTSSNKNHTNLDSLSTNKVQPKTKLVTKTSSLVEQNNSNSDDEKEVLKAQIAAKNRLLSQTEHKVRRLETQLKKAQDAAKRNTNVSQAKLTRLAGFKFITSSKDSKYAIVQAPNKTITLFKGESFYSHLGNHKVTLFDARNKKLIVDDKYLIDETLLPRKAKSSPAKKYTTKQKTTAKTRLHNARNRTSISRSASYGKEIITEYKVLSFSLDNRVAVVKDKQDLIYRILIDEVFKGYGHLLNITEKGDLIFNDYIIQHTNKL